MGLCTLFMIFVLLHHLLPTDFYIFFYPLFILSYYNFLLPYLYFRLTCLSNIIKLTPNPINFTTFRYGGILTSIWIWYGEDCASMISIFFFAQFSNDYTISFLHFLYHFAFIFWYKHYMILASIFEYFLFHFFMQKTS